MKADNSENQPYGEDEHYISKSQLKREVEALQNLGVKLSELSVDTLNKFDLDEDLLAALLFAQTIKSNSAKRRQMQYIGKLMRKTDAESIKQQYEQFLHARTEQNAKFHQLEIWRDQLLSVGDTAINALIEEYPQLDRSRLRQWVRNAAKEEENNKPRKSARQLFQYLKENIV